MWFLGFAKANCENCYACVRVCPVHAIKVKNEQAQIIKERCIVCGKCLSRCPQNAQMIKSEKEMVKHYISGRQKVVASLAPSFAAIFGKDSNKLSTALKMLGFDYVEETASIVDPIIDEYEKYANKSDDNTYITSFCPSVNNLIQKYYKELAKNIIPVVSPSIFHSKVLKEKYGKDTRVIFIGPCVAKKSDGHDNNAIDIVLTFDDLKKWLEEEKINLNELEENPFDYISEEKRLLPTIKGLTRCIERNNPKKSVIQIDGIKDCMKILNQVKEGKFKNTLLEMSSCRHSCIGGSGMPNDEVNCYERKENLKQYASLNYKSEISDEKLINKYENIDIYKKFEPKEVLLNNPNDEQLKEILHNMGKFEKMDELNCGSCGYHTCKEKAIAIYNNMAEISMCLPFMREKAEDLSSIIFDTTPNMIVIVDKNLEIVQFNLASEKFFEMSSYKAKELPVAMFLDEEIFKTVKETKVSLLKQKVTLSQNNATVIQSVIWLEKNKFMLWIGDDITKDIQLQEKIKNIKIDAVNMAQKVINKQMVVAQEIASLLGETTAETKVTLTQLKNLIMEDEVNL